LHSKNNFNKEKIQLAIKDLLQNLGEELPVGCLENTPQNVAEFLEKFLVIEKDKKSPEEILEVFTSEKITQDQIILQSNIEFYSLCEHHLLPFRGVVHVAYIPNEKSEIVGFGNIPELISYFAQRLQLQEKLTEQITESINHILKPAGLIVLLEAHHDCMAIRGCKKNPLVKTISKKGCFLENTALVKEFYSLIQISEKNNI